MILEVIGMILIVLGIVWVIFINSLSKNNNNFPKEKRKDMENICILIPARDESRVIEDLLISIKNQTMKVNMKDVVIIVETKDDPTIKIAKKYKATIFIRKKLHLKSKGYALNEVIEDLEKKKKYYDAYFILDADNVLDKNFIKEMNKSYKEGYDIAIGYRNLKNGNDSVISACSGITFTFLNANTNKIKSRESRNVTLSGTGLYIVGDLIKKWKSFPFHSLTEDYELTLYSILNNLTSVYNEEAIFYDEQPIEYKNTINQRVRWIRGYFSVRLKYLPKLRKKIFLNPNYGSVIGELTGMKPYILMIIGAILYIINQIINIIIFIPNKTIVTICLLKILFIIILAYLLFSVLTYYLLKDDNKINLTKSMKIKTILYSPIFFATYIPCAIKALLQKEVRWEKVEHTRRWESKS